MRRPPICLPLGLRASLRFAAGHADGAALLTPPADAPPDAAMAMAARSFWAAAICLPALIWLHLVDAGQPAAYPLPRLLLDVESFVVGWAGFAVLSHRLAARLGRASRWPQFITAWNWCNLLQYAALLLAGLPAMLGAPDMLVELIWLVAAGWVLWLEWYAIRLTLLVPGLTAAALVALDLSIGMMLASITG